MFIFQWNRVGLVHQNQRCEDLIIVWGSFIGKQVLYYSNVQFWVEAWGQGTEQKVAITCRDQEWFPEELLSDEPFEDMR